LGVKSFPLGEKSRMVRIESKKETPKGRKSCVALTRACQPRIKEQVHGPGIMVDKVLAPS
jgi:hypothetical protein